MNLRSHSRRSNAWQLTCILVWLFVGAFVSLPSGTQPADRSALAFEPASAFEPVPPPSSAPFQPLARVRRPVQALLVDGGRTLLVVNQQSGSVSSVDVASRRVVGETDVGGRLEHAAIDPASGLIVLVDSSGHQLLACRHDHGRLRMIDRIRVGPSPQSVLLDSDRRRAYVASRWSHRWEAIGVRLDVLGERPADDGKADHGKSSEDKTQVFERDNRQMIELPFAARSQLLLPDRRHLLVTDAFGGGLAIIRLDDPRLLGAHETSGHNQRGVRLASGSSEAWIAQQIGEPGAALTEDNVASGRALRNVLRRIPVSALTPLNADLNQSSREFALDQPDLGAGDPTDVLVDSNGRAAMALGGVHEVALYKFANGVLSAPRRVRVGTRPLALVALPASSMFVSVNSLDDSLSFVDWDGGKVIDTVALGPPTNPSPRERGERSFFDATLSARGHVSCHSCHTDGHANGRLADTQGDDSFGTPKRTLTLLGTGLTYRWAWNGQQPNLHDQVRKSIEQTMHGRTSSAHQVTDIVAFLHGLAPPPPIAPATDDPTDRASIERGRALFQRLDCGRCHIPPLVYSSNEAFDVGLADEHGLRKFNPPSLRGVSQGTRFFHDNRASSLEAVFTEFAHPGETQLNGAELRDLVRFLKSL